MIETIVGIITWEGYKARTIAIVKGEFVIHPEIKNYAQTREQAIKKFGENIILINLNNPKAFI